jgi:hypothetical protein
MEETKFVFLVEIDKSVGLKEAKRLARKTLQKIRTPTYVETDSIYRFKNIPRAYFDLTSFKTHQSTPTMKLIYGSLNRSLETNFSTHKSSSMEDTQNNIHLLTSSSEDMYQQKDTI